MKKFKLRKLLIIFIGLLITFLFANGFKLDVYAGENTTINIGKASEVEIEFENTIIINKTENYFKDEKMSNMIAGLDKDNFQQSVVDDFYALDSFMNNSFSWLNSLQNADLDNFDWAGCVDGFVKSAASLAACFGPYGMIVSAGISIVNGLFKLGMGGQDPDSEITQLQFQLNSELKEISNKIDKVDERLNDLSSQIDKTAEKIVDSITTELDNKEAKKEVNEFINLSSVDDFSYKFFKNYVLGKKQSENIYSNTAYYAALKESIDNGDSEEVIKAKYDQLYAAIMNNMDVYLNYIIKDNNEKSIVQYYYDVLCANPELCKDSTPEIETLKFADDLYNTFIAANQLIYQCHLYYGFYMMKYETEIYDVKGYKEIFFSDLFGNSCVELLKTRLESFEKQFAKDLVYILSLDEFYIVQENNDYIYEVSKDDPSFGKLMKGQKIYFNSVTEYVSKYFNLDKNDFHFEISNNDNANDYLIVGNEEYITVKLFFKDLLLYEFKFDVYDNRNYIIGTGEEESPYLISTPEQFLNINNNLDKHFKLINDIDLSTTGSIKPFGTKVVDNAYTFKAFTGSLDGNGYSIKNLTISGSFEKIGLFAELGESAVVSNIKFENPKILASLGSAQINDPEYYAGIVAGINNGAINYCSITSDGTTIKINPERYFIIDDPWKTLFNPSDDLVMKKYGLEFILDNAQHDVNIIAKVGGIAGQNNNQISCCTIENVKIIGASRTNIGGQRNVQQNQNNLYVGGITGYNYGSIQYDYLESNVQVGGSARTEHNANTTIRPYINSYVGGITAFTNKKDYSNISDVISNATPILVNAEVKAESNWGELYKNVNYKKDAYVPNISTNNKDKIVSKLNLKELIKVSPVNVDIQYEFVDLNNDNIINGTEYGNNNPQFDYSELIFKNNGEKIDYTYINCYGFNTLVEDKNGQDIKVVVLFSANINGINTIIAKEVDVKVKNSIINAEGTNIKNVYNINEFELEGLRFRLYYQVGNPSIIELTDNFIKNNNIVLNGNPNQTGINKLSFTYNDFNIEFEINVYCDHGYDFYDETNENFVLINDLSKEATCTEVGYNVYECKHCHTQEIYYLGTVEHEYIIDGYVGATCNSIGHTGKIYCSLCNYVYSEDETIPLINHEYSYFDENQHKCLLKYNEVECGHLEAHNFVVQDTVQLLNIDGESKYYIVLNKKCYDCGYQEEETLYDENLVENQQNTKIVISDGYILPTQNEVVVYVHLVNNKYVINGANFGIRYSDGLELIDIEDGNIFSSSWELKNGTPTNNGYNFFCASGDQKFSNDGILLKLRFRIIDEVVVGNKYDVSLVYSNGIDKDGELVSGGFSIENGKKQLFTTYSGTITVVDHLPGDVNSDGSVDIMDAILISLYVINPSENHIDKVNANVNLCIPNDGESEVDSDDAIAILKYIIGSFTDNKVHQVKDNKVNIKLNYNISYTESSLNDITLIIDDYYVLNDNEQYVPNTYFNVGLDELSINREGYKFLGWFTSPYGGKKVEFYKDSINKIGPLPIDSSIETLYAQWELNTVTISANDSTHKYNNLDEYILGDNQIKTLDKDTIDNIDDGYEKKYEVEFNSEEFKKMKHYLQYETCIWNLYSNDELIKQFKSLYEAICYLREVQYYGNVTLLPNYSNPNIDLDKIGELWTNSRFDSPIWRNINGDKITSEDIIESFERLGSTDSYYVKAEHHEKEYKVYFDFNGGVDMNGTFPYDVDIYGNKTNYIVVTYSNANVFDSSDKVEIIKNNYYFNKWTFTSTDNQTISVDEGIDKVNLLTVIENYGSQSQEINLKLNWAGENVKVTFKDQSDSSDKVVYEVNYAYGDEFINENTKQYFSDSDIKYWYFIENNEMKIIEEGTIVEDASDFDIYAVFNEYTITLNLNVSNVDDNSSYYSTYTSVNGLNNNSQFNLKYGENFTLVAPTSEYYTFMGWYYGDKQITDSTGKSLSEFSFLKDNYTLTARWNKVKNGYTYIKTVEDLKNINKNTSGKYFLIKNIGLDINENWTPLNTFSGILDGNNKTISGMRYTRGATKLTNNLFVGLFSWNSGQIINLNMDSCIIYAEPYHDGDKFIYAGIISGHGSGTIKNCKVTNSSVEVHRTRSEIGIFVGCYNGVIDGCMVQNSEIYGNGDIGGITGGLCGKVSNCKVENSIIKLYATIYKTGSGGIVGFINGGMIENCSVNKITFKIDGEYKLKPAQGAVVGYINRGSILYVSATNFTKTKADGFLTSWKEKYGFLNLKTKTVTNNNYFGKNTKQQGYAGQIEGDVTIKYN